MAKKRHLLTAVVACFALLANAAELTTEKLPVKRVVLYKNGVGYFEHTGRIRGDQELKIEFTSSQLNDVLKSLTVLDLNGGKITGVGYNSVAPIAEQLKSLRLPLGQDVSLADFLTALRGSRVEMRNGSTQVSGRLLGVEQKTIKKGEQEENTFIELSVITDAGEVHTFPLTPSLGLRIADHDLSEEISRYLTLVGSARDQDLRRMTISTSGTGERNVFVSYVSEVPVWKSTYRILLPTNADSKPLLQGWAIVDNTVGEDWNNVELSLVAGAPQSFIQDLSKPYYTRRPVVGLPETAMLTPQTHEGTMADMAVFAPGIEVASAAPAAPKPVDRLQTFAKINNAPSSGSFGIGPGFHGIYGTVVDPQGAVIGNAMIIATDDSGARQTARSDSSGMFRLNLNAGRHRIDVQAPGFQTATQTIVISGNTARKMAYRLNVGSMSSTVEVTADADVIASADDAEYGRNSGGIVNLITSAESSDTGAETEDLGDLFEYNLKERVTILKNHSALVPIINSRIDAEKVTLWSRSSRPLRALWITNNSDLTLDSGSFNVIENNAFAGEGLIEPLKPKERRLLSYAIDRGVRVEHKDGLEYRPATHIKIANGMIFQTSERRDHQVYTVRNSDAQEREVIVEHPVRGEWKLAGTMKPEETSASSYRFRVKVPAGQTATLNVDEVQPLTKTLALSNVTDEQIKLFFSDMNLKPELEQALRKIILQKGKVLAVDQELSQRQGEISVINQDQQRLRENMKALKGSVEERALVQRYTRELNNQEDKLQATRSEMAKLEVKRAEVRQQLDKMMQDLTLDEEI